jgi:hypothetical protein
MKCSETKFKDLCFVITFKEDDLCFVITFKEDDY